MFEENLEASKQKVDFKIADYQLNANENIKYKEDTKEKAVF